MFRLSSRQGHGGFAFGVRQQVAGIVDYGNIFIWEIGHAGRNQVHDGSNLGRGHDPTRIGHHHHGSLRRRLIAHENTLLGFREMNASSLNGANLRDGLRQLAFNGCAIANLLHKPTCGHGPLFEQGFYSAQG